MIQIHLKKLMDDYGINISDLYRLTGISRSTLTPMVNDPESVGSLKVDILDTLCDFFGVGIDDLLTFVPSKNKYSIFEIWNNQDSGIAAVDMKKELGSSNRHAIIGVFFDSVEIDSAKNITVRISAELTPLTKKQIKKLSIDKAEGFPNEKELIDGHLFLKDFKKQDRGTRIITTKIILNSIFSGDFKKKYEDIREINSTWMPHDFLDHSNSFTFKVDNKNNFEISLDKEKTNGFN